MSRARPNRWSRPARFARLAGAACVILAFGSVSSFAADPDSDPDAGSGVPAASPASAPWPIHTLNADKIWHVNLPRGRRLDASALLRRSDGTLLTLNDQETAVYRMVFREGTNAVDLLPLENCLTREQLAAYAPQKIQRYDLEGLAEDSKGRLYVSEEANRWILRWDPVHGKVDRLEIDWTPVKKWFAPLDFNASFEGIAIGGGRLYVANERHQGRLITVDLETLGVIDDFRVAPAGIDSDDIHYTDLCWADDALWVLLRDVRKLLKVDPKAKRVLAEFDFTAMERARENAYGVIFAPGFMEGLSVDDRHIWLLTDNNGMGRTANLSDKRPTLFRCPKPVTPGPTSTP
ncbi:MAG: esterase-like activity of phytase family protein [Limisphaerales bacterium]